MPQFPGKTPDLDQPVQERQPHRGRRHRLQDPRVPARQARQGRGVRALQAAPRRRRRRDRPHVPRRREVPGGPDRGAQDAVPLRRRLRRALHGHRVLRAARRARSQAAEALRWTKPNDTVDVLFIDGRPSDLQLPASVELEVTETEPGLRGDTASGGGTKPATLETEHDPGPAVRRSASGSASRSTRARRACRAPEPAQRCRSLPATTMSRRQDQRRAAARPVPAGRDRPRARRPDRPGRVDVHARSPTPPTTTRLTSTRTSSATRRAGRSTGSHRRARHHAGRAARDAPSRRRAGRPPDLAGGRYLRGRRDRRDVLRRRRARLRERHPRRSPPRDAREPATP